MSLLSELSKKHADSTTQNEINNILNSSKKLGLLLNERFVNIPAKISDPLFTSLASEIDRISKKDPSYKFDYYIMICKLHKPKGNKGIVCNTYTFIFKYELIIFRNRTSIFKW